jgi:hypothetical protein
MRTMVLRPVAIVIAYLAVALAATAARAADPVFPPGSRVGLVPPAGFTVSKDFAGFEDRDHKAAILLAELPAEAYEQIVKGATTEILKASGASVESNEPFTLASGPAFLVIGHQSAGGLTVQKWVLVASMPTLTAAATVQVPEDAKDVYPDAVVRAALATIVVRASAPADELLAVLPFTLNDLAGFHPIGGRRGNAALLTDGPKDTVDPSEQPLILITAIAGAPPDPAERDRFARTLFGATPGIKDIRLTRAEPQRVGGYPGHEIVADARDMKTDTDLAVAQWLRFGTGGYLHMLAIGRKDAWASLYPRFRAVRDGVDPK